VSKKVLALKTKAPC